MATKDMNVELPINLGMGESTTEQGRDGSSYVSKNTRFLKKDSVSTTLPLVTTWEAAYDNIRLLPTAEEVYMLDQQTVSRLDEDGVVTTLATTFRPFSPDFQEVALGRSCFAWPQAVLCGDEVVVTWLEAVPEFGYIPHIAVLGKDGGTLQKPAPIVAAGAPADMPVCPKYTLTKISDDDVIIAYVAAPDSTISPPSQLVQVRYTRAGSLFVATADVYFLDAGGFQTAYVTSCYDGVQMHHVTYDAPVDQTANWNTGVTRYWVVGTDGVLVSRRDLRAELSASSFAALAAHPTSGEIWMLYRGYDRTNLYLVDVEPAVPPAPTALTTQHPWFKSGEATGSDNAEFSPHDLAFRQFSRLEDGFLYFKENGDAIAVVQGAGADDTTDDDRNLIGMSTIALGTTISSGATPITFPNLSFTGGAFEASDALCIPVVERASWHSLFISATGTESDAVEVATPVEVWYRGRTIGGYPQPTQVAVTNRPLAQPTYAINAIVSLPSAGGASMHTFHSMDEATDHTGIFLHPEGSTFSATVPSRPANYRSTLGSVLVDGDDVYILTSKQVGARLVGGDGSGGYNAEDVRLEGWGCAVNFLKLQQSKDPQAGFTSQQPVIGFDLVSVLSGNDVLPTALPVPPIASAPSFVGTGGDARSRTFKFAWCFIDADGIRHRGPLSHAYVTQDTSVDLAVDEGNFRVPVPGAYFSLPRDRYFLEVYANPILDDVVGDTIVLTDTLPLPDPPFYDTNAASVIVPYSYNNTSPGLPFPYTDGGVLPNEARPTTGPITFNRQRVWSFDYKRLFFSKTEGYKKPFGFNSNLYFDSPDGTDFTGIASLDEQTVAFTRSGVYVNRGQLPNDLGAGGNTTLYQVTSPSGCKTHKAVVETPQGVFFQGERGIYMLQRSLEVTYVGYDVEDSLAEELVTWACYDRGNNEVIFATATKLLVFNVLLGQWCVRHEGTEFSHGAWHPTYGLLMSQGTSVFTESREVVNVSIISPLKHSTPWVSLDTKQGYQRCKRFLIQGTWDRGLRYFPETGQDPDVVPAYTATEHDTYVTFRVFVDHQETPAQELIVDLRQFSKSPLELELPNAVQKCRAVRLEMETQEANLDLTITSVVAVVGLKVGTDKRPNTPSY